MRRFERILIGAAALLIVSGCDPSARYSGGPTIDYTLVGTETVIDPQTGEVVILSHWEYEDGVKVTTKDRFAKDTPNTDRRATSRPAVRVAD